MVVEEIKTLLRQLRDDIGVEDPPSGLRGSITKLRHSVKIRDRLLIAILVAFIVAIVLLWRTVSDANDTASSAKNAANSARAATNSVAQLADRNKATLNCIRSTFNADLKYQDEVNNLLYGQITARSAIINALLKGDQAAYIRALRRSQAVVRALVVFRKTHPMPLPGLDCRATLRTIKIPIITPGPTKTVTSTAPGPTTTIRTPGPTVTVKAPPGKHRR